MDELVFVSHMCLTQAWQSVPAAKLKPKIAEAIERLHKINQLREQITKLEDQ